MREDITIRPAARVVLLDDTDRLLMLRIHDPSATRGPNPVTADFWLLVGSGPGQAIWLNHLHGQRRVVADSALGR